MVETSNRTKEWVKNLADQELSICAGERGSIDIYTTKEQILTAETETILKELQHHFAYLVKLFNSRVNQDSLKIQLAKDNSNRLFSLSRNGMRLLVTRPQLGVIQLVCDKKMAGAARSSVMFSGLVEAKFGIFHDVEWHFLGSRVTTEQVARHYLTEFIQVSRASTAYLS